MRYYRFLKNNSDDPLPSLDPFRTDTFEMVESDGSTWVYIPSLSPSEAQSTLRGNPQFVRFEEVNVNEYVDWGVQWSTHCPDFKDYNLQIDLSKYTSSNTPLPILKLNAGPGFGDLSHPTTRLTLQMMSSHLKGKTVIDIGCGSGILTLASILLGAEKGIGIDIDPEAILHAKENAALNHLEHHTNFCSPNDYLHPSSASYVILMNMIRTQQQEAWSSLPILHGIMCDVFTSGILISEKNIYLEECRQRGWKLMEACEQGDWMGFHFK